MNCIGSGGEDEVSVMICIRMYKSPLMVTYGVKMTMIHIHLDVINSNHA
jgi:hypothetical protein